MTHSLIPLTTSNQQNVFFFLIVLTIYLQFVLQQLTFDIVFSNVTLNQSSRDCLKLVYCWGVILCSRWDLKVIVGKLICLSMISSKKKAEIVIIYYFSLIAGSHSFEHFTLYTSILENIFCVYQLYNFTGIYLNVTCGRCYSANAFSLCTLFKFKVSPSPQ